MTGPTGSLVFRKRSLSNVLLIQVSIAALAKLKASDCDYFWAPLRVVRDQAAWYFHHRTSKELSDKSPCISNEAL